MDNFPMLRITLLGGAGCGKTAIANSFLNNSFDISYSNTTEFPQLYHKIVYLPPEGKMTGQDRRVCVELEDTFASNSTQEKSILSFLSMKIEEREYDLEMFKYPFTNWKLPFSPYNPNQKSQTLTRCRMGFFIIFDCCVESSFMEAIYLYKLLQSRIEEEMSKMKPIVFLIANKIDIPNDDTSTIISKAELFCDQEFVRLFQVSALSLKNIRKAFYDMCYFILGSISLWRIEIPESSSEEEKETDLCAII